MGIDAFLCGFNYARRDARFCVFTERFFEISVFGVGLDKKAKICYNMSLKIFLNPKRRRNNIEA